MARNDWDNLKAGHKCPMCEDLSNPDLLQPGHINHYGTTVAAFENSVLRLSVDQFSRGYCVLISHHHGPEPSDLEIAPRTGFFDELTRSGQAVQQAFKADKLNYLLLGNSIPHLHAHLIPRYHGDPAGGRPLLGDPDRPAPVPAVEYARRVSSIQVELTR